MTRTLTPKQGLVAHLKALHGDRTYKGTHNDLMLWHKGQHEGYRLAHNHDPLTGYALGDEIIDVKISLSPPKNPSASRNGDRNWTLHIAHLSQGHGWRYELPGTSATFPEEAKVAASRILGWSPTWVAVGWGFQVAEGEKEDGTGQ